MSAHISLVLFFLANGIMNEAKYLVCFMSVLLSGMRQINVAILLNFTEVETVSKMFAHPHAHLIGDMNGKQLAIRSIISICTSASIILNNNTNSMFIVRFVRFGMLTGAFHMKNSPCNLLQLQSTYYPLPAKCKARP